MMDNLEGLTDIFNMDLKNIKVSEKLKLRTLEKCMRNKKNSIHKCVLKVTCTIAACLLMGIIIYPIYNKNNELNNESITMDARDKGTKTLEEQPKMDHQPYMGESILKEKTNITEDEINKTFKSEILEENQKQVNKIESNIIESNIIESDKKSKELNIEKKIIVLNDKPIMPAKMGSIKSEKKDISYENQDIIVATTTDIIDEEKLTKNNNKNNPAISCDETDLAKSYLVKNKETKMRTLSVQETRDFLKSNIKIPSYIPKDFIMEQVLVGADSNSYKLYEITYSNNSQYFKITEYKNTNYNSELRKDSNKELRKDSNKELRTVTENNMIININNVLVNYILCESIDIKDLPYVKFAWENMGKKYTAEGNAPWSEVINIVSSITR